MILKSIFFNWANNAVWKTVENLRKYRDIELATMERTNLDSEPNYHTTKFVIEILLAVEIKKQSTYESIQDFQC